MNHHLSLQEALSKVGTPFYFYDLNLLEDTINNVKEALKDHDNFCVHYAVKANSNPEILRLMADAGLGADTVSGGEVSAAVAAGFSPKDILLAGVGKTDEEIYQAITLGIDSLNVESEAELDVIESMAIEIGKPARVSLPASRTEIIF